MIRRGRARPATSASWTGPSRACTPSMATGSGCAGASWAGTGRQAPRRSGATSGRPTCTSGRRSKAVIGVRPERLAHWAASAHGRRVEMRRTLIGAGIGAVGGVLALAAAGAWAGTRTGPSGSPPRPRRRPRPPSGSPSPSSLTTGGSPRRPARPSAAWPGWGVGRSGRGHSCKQVWPTASPGRPIAWTGRPTGPATS